MKKHKIIIPMVIALLALIIALALILSRCNAQSDETLYGSTPSPVPTGSISSSTGAEVPGSSVPATTVPTSTPAISIPSSAPTVPSTAPTQSTGSTQPTTTPTTPTTVPATAPTQPAKPNGCSHTFTEWEYEEYTYTVDYGKDHPGYVPGFPTTATYTSHRKIRICAKCNYKETDGTADHICQKGSDNHTVTTVKEGVCGVRDTMRSTCTICGWYVEYEGKFGPHTLVYETKHLTDYTEYTNELDAEIQTCTTCGASDVVYIRGKGWSDYNRYEIAVTHFGGAACSLEHPEYQTVERDFVYDSNGYVKQFTLYWWYNGSRYSQVIKCDKASLVAAFAAGVEVTDGVKCHFKLTTQASPYKVSWTS